MNRFESNLEIKLVGTVPEHMWADACSVYTVSYRLSINTGVEISGWVRREEERGLYGDIG